MTQIQREKEELGRVVAERSNQLEIARQNLKLVQDKFKAEMARADNDISDLEKANSSLEANLSAAIQRATELERLIEQQRAVSSKADRLSRVNSKFGPQDGRPAAESYPETSQLFSAEVDILLSKPTTVPTRTTASVPSRGGKTGLSLLDIQELIDTRIATAPAVPAPAPVSAPVQAVYHAPPPTAMMYNPIYMPPQGKLYLYLYRMFSTLTIFKLLTL